MPMKIKDPKRPSKAPQNKVVPLRKFKQTNFETPKAIPPFQTSTSIDVCKDYSNPVSSFTPSVKVKDILSVRKESSKEEVSSSPDNTLLSVENAANDSDNVKCQDLNRGLSIWLESFSGIGMDLNRPTSSSNPGRHCPFPASTSDLIFYHNKRAGSIKSRKKTQLKSKEHRPASPHSSRGFREKRNGKYSNCGVAGWSGPRPPTLLQLLTQSYKAGYSFTKSAQKTKKGCIHDHENKVKTTEPISRMLHGEHTQAPLNPRPEVPDNNTSSLVTLGNGKQTPLVSAEKFYKEEQLAYNQWLLHSARECNHIPRPVPLHMTNIVKLKKAYNLVEFSRYRNTLWKGDLTNPHIDYGLEFRVDPVLGFEVYTRHSSRANSAARFAPASRFYREKTIFKDLQWEMHLANYVKYERGIWNLKEMLGESLKLWGESYDLCMHPGIGYHHELLLPPVPEEFKEEDHCQTSAVAGLLTDQSSTVQVKRETNTKRVKITDSDKSNDSVCNFFLQKSWKKLPDMLVTVPEAFDASTQLISVSAIATPSHEDIDKICRLKHG